MSKELWRNSPSAKDSAHRNHTKAEADAAHPELAKYRTADERVHGAKHGLRGLYLSMSSRSTYSPVRVNTTDSFFFAGNPLICGFRPLELILNAEKAGIGLPNFHQSVYLVAGSGHGTTQGRHGLVPMGKRKVDQRGALIECGKLGEILRPHFAKTKTLEQCLYQLEALILEDQRKSQKPKGSSKYRQQLSPPQILAHIQTNTFPAISALQINYITLTRTCTDLLYDIRDQILADMVVMPDLRPIDIPLQHRKQEGMPDMGLVTMVFDALYEVVLVIDEQWNMFRKESRGPLGPAKGGPWTKSTSVVLDRFISMLEE
ncbi:hypothetical protein DL95DRAFT_462625 [Leptodontidium sp. 2 PMI_412]|nr:hypothetical protein DL95DRAFT_462625 [Leptodontidium sp. 2 PMI_412]